MNTSNHARRLFCLLIFLLFAGAAGAVQEDDEIDVEEAVEAVEAIEQAEARDELPEEAAEPPPEEATEPDDAEPVQEEDLVEEDVAADEPDAATDPQPEQAEERPETGEPPAEATDPDPAPSTPETFTLQGHPVFSPDQAERVYGPLVRYLNETLPYRFDLRLSRDFHRYWLDARRGETPDLVIEEAHMTAFRMQRDDYSPLVAAAAPMSYSLMARAEHEGAGLADFIGRPVSSMPSPSLGYLVLARWYDNPMQQPVVLSNASSWLDAIEIVFAAEAEAAIVPRTLAERYVNLERVQTSREFPGLTLSASPAVPEGIREEIRQAMLILHEDDDYIAVLHELDLEQFVEAEPGAYEGLEEWLRAVTRAF
ncbi:PhnD/SsuA/transferrin family substrate-binding protein [Wenzhouxiangella sp. AB-CW3]|uniref:phosphate/phosphite/phosphonate ABC transporter substrate-binding protein n=1 Tax=Wenzhouxiangella sp. AB-CW3 TaxID=2771012 RepID=UPI00168AAE2C|nr:PhnD/SsuA/transferrin family substrate-binding protein [Wenzhouxiangella sp. AB-CW3]QOC21103.1 PhnD/SsuA/transferrin family substrate-binding protein [Wenzhouxiangella sp. AB-CW3]